MERWKKIVIFAERNIIIYMVNHSRINYVYKGINEYKNFFFSDVYLIYVDNTIVGERHIDSSIGRDLFFVSGKGKYSEEIYEKYCEKNNGCIVDEECIIVRNEDDLLKFIDTVDNFIEENNSK